MGFTMCKVEGKYQSDTLYGILADDQPFVDGFNADDTFFSRDDCEGRLQQGLLVKRAIVSLARLDSDHVLQLIRQKNHPLLRELADTTICALINCTRTIAWLFDNNILTFELSVGEATFASYPNGVRPLHPKLTGHSFGTLFFDPQRTPKTALPWISQLPTGKFRKGMQVVEATGWMDEYASGTQQRIERMFSRHIATSRQTVTESPTIRSCTTVQQCDQMYMYIYTVGAAIVFGWDINNNKWVYGASPSQFLSNQVALVQLTDFISMLRTFALDRTKPVHALVQQAFANQALLPELDPVALHDLQNKSEFIHNTMHSLQIYIRPPPNTPKEKYARIGKWQPITEAHLNDISVLDSVAFVT
eukprot:3936563-Rhodomonas_salina.1